MGWQESLMPVFFLLLFTGGFHYQQRQQIQITKLLIMSATISGIILSCWLFGLKGYPYFLFLLSFSAGMVFYPKKQQQIRLLFLPLLSLGFTLGLAPLITPILERLQKEIEAKSLVEAQLKNSNQQLKRFTYMASHDLKEPLRSIGSFTYLLNQELKEDLKESSKEYLSFISGGVTRMHTLLEDLLA